MNSGYPEEMMTENNNPDWYLNQGIYMYNQENELVFVSHNDVEKYEKDGWYKEPVAFVSNGKEEKYVYKLIARSLCLPLHFAVKPQHQYCERCQPYHCHYYARHITSTHNPYPAESVRWYSRAPNR